MAERKESHRAAQEEFRRALTGEFEPVTASPEQEKRVDEATPAAFPTQVGGTAPLSDAKRAVAARAERMQAQKARRRRRIMGAGGVLVLLVLAAVCAFAFLPVAGTTNIEGFFDENAQEGQAPNKTPAELQAELNRIVEEGMFNISISSVIEFTSPDATGKAYIENVPGNPYDMKVEMTLADSGEVVYSSKGIAPGNYIEDIALESTLEPGMHEALATFTAFDRETHEEKGKAAAEVTLLVGKGGDASE